MRLRLYEIPYSIFASHLGSAPGIVFSVPGSILQQGFQTTISATLPCSLTWFIMTTAPAFIPFIARSVQGLSPARGLQSALTRRVAIRVPISQRPRMQCTPTGEVPDMTSSVMDNMERKIKDALSPSRLQIIPTIGDPNGAHVQIEVISDRFEGMVAVKRHQAVYQAIWEELSVRFLAFFHILLYRPPIHFHSSSPNLTYYNVPFCSHSNEHRGQFMP